MNKMGKTYRRSDSVSLSKTRLARKHVHSYIRNHNKKCSEDEIEIFNCKQPKIKYFNYHGGYFPPCAIPPFYFYFDDSYLSCLVQYRWNSQEQILSDTIYHIEQLLTMENDPPWTNRYLLFFKALQKQIRRRETPGRFYTHRKNKILF